MAEFDIETFDPSDLEDFNFEALTKEQQTAAHQKISGYVYAKMADAFAYFDDGGTPYQSVLAGMTAALVAYLFMVQRRNGAIPTVRAAMVTLTPLVNQAAEANITAFKAAATQ